MGATAYAVCIIVLAALAMAATVAIYEIDRRKSYAHFDQEVASLSAEIEDLRRVAGALQRKRDAQGRYAR